MYDSKHPLKSLGIMAPLVALALFIVNRIKPGLGLTDADVAPLIDAVDVTAGLVLGIIGRWRATKEVSLSAVALIAFLPLALIACATDQVGTAAGQVQQLCAAGAPIVAQAQQAPDLSEEATIFKAYAEAACKASGAVAETLAPKIEPTTPAWLRSVLDGLQVAAQLAPVLLPLL